MSMKESSFEPGETLYAGAFEIDGIQVIFAAKLRLHVVAIAINAGVKPSTIDIAKFKTIKVVEV